MNPELRRNVWLELTRHRVIVAPVVLVLALLLVSSNEERPWPAIFDWATGLFVVMVHLWGTRKTGESVSDEVRERTWDGQRLSSLTPWAMTWGKLLGAPAFPWYVAALCVVVMSVAAVMDGSIRGAHWVALGLAASGLALHGAALAGSIQASRKDSKLGARVGTLLLVVVAVSSAFAYRKPADGELEAVAWFGVAMDPVRFATMSAALFAVWAVVAAHREMQRELAVRALPWAYPAFALFAGAYVAGFDTVALAGRGTAFVFATFIAATGLTYYGLLADVTSGLVLGRIAFHARAGRWMRAAQELPLWATMLPVAAGFAGLAAMQPVPASWNGEAQALGAYPIAIFLMVLRDAGIFAFFALAARARRYEAAALLYLFVVDLLLPMLLSAMGSEDAAAYLMPFGRLGGGAAAGVLAAHCAVVAAALAWRWRRFPKPAGA